MILSVSINTFLRFEGAKIAPNAIFVITKNIENSSRKKEKILLEIFFVDSIGEEMRTFLRKVDESLERAGLEKMTTMLIFF